MSKEDDKIGVKYWLKNIIEWYQVKEEMRLVGR
jgi:hypothetical protein